MFKIVLKVLKVHLPLYFVIYISGISISYLFLEIPKEFSDYLYESLFSFRHVGIILLILIVEIFHQHLKKP